MGARIPVIWPEPALFGGWFLLVPGLGDGVVFDQPALQGVLQGGWFLELVPLSAQVLVSRCWYLWGFRAGAGVFGDVGVSGGY